jgi:hypothetical protein
MNHTIRGRVRGSRQAGGGIQRACVRAGRTDGLPVRCRAVPCRAVVSLVLLPLALLVGRARLLPYCCVQETTVNAL